jgi:hypothetical protein
MKETDKKTKPLLNLTSLLGIYQIILNITSAKDSSK